MKQPNSHVCIFNFFQKLNLGIVINFNKESNVAMGHDIIQRFSFLPHQLISEENGTAGIVINIHDFVKYINEDVASTHFHKDNSKNLTIVDSFSEHPKKIFHNCTEIFFHGDPISDSD